MYNEMAKCMLMENDEFEMITYDGKCKFNVF